MTRWSCIAALGALLFSGCVRFDLESADENIGDAVRISSSDAVVLCPLSAITESSGMVSIVWAGYPPADDRLQLRHARVSSLGELVQAPRSVAELGAELDGLALVQGASGLEVQLMQRGRRSVVELEMDERASADLREPPADFTLIAESCQARVQTADAALHIFRGQADGELPLFVAQE